MQNTHHSAPSISQFLGDLSAINKKILVIKYGGNAMTDPALQQIFAQDIALLQRLGAYPIVVHGGGPQIDIALKRLGKEGQFINGMRVTDDETMQVVEWVLCGEVQKILVAHIIQQQGHALGMSGKDGHLLVAQKIYAQDAAGQALDIGHVGEVVRVNTDILEMCIQRGYVPVVSSVAMDEQGQTYNVNADLAAAAIAKALGAHKLMMMSNIPGVLDQQKSLIACITPVNMKQYIDDGTISGGMLPKIQSAMDAAQHGVGAVHIIDGRVVHALLTTLLPAFMGQAGILGTVIQS